MSKRIYRYGTGDEVPEDGQYLYSREENTSSIVFVWHYFLVEVEGN